MAEKYLHIPPENAKNIVTSLRKSINVSDGALIQSMFHAMTHEVPEEPITHLQLIYLGQLLQVLEGVTLNAKYSTFKTTFDHLPIQKKSKRALMKHIPDNARDLIYDFIASTKVEYKEYELSYQVMSRTTDGVTMKANDISIKKEPNQQDITRHVQRCINKLEKILPIAPHILKEQLLVANSTLLTSPRKTVTKALLALSPSEYKAFVAYEEALRSNSVATIKAMAIKNIIAFLKKQEHISEDNAEEIHTQLRHTCYGGAFTINDMLFTQAILPFLHITAPISEHKNIDMFTEQLTKAVPTRTPPQEGSENEQTILEQDETQRLTPPPGTYTPQDAPKTVQVKTICTNDKSSPTLGQISICSHTIS